MLPNTRTILTEVVKGLVEDGTITKEQVMDQFEKVISEESLGEIDAVVSADKSSSSDSMKELFGRVIDPADTSITEFPEQLMRKFMFDALAEVGGTETIKQAMTNSNGTFLKYGPVEQQIKMSFDPESMNVDFIKA
tara:strand:- start:114 stop:521 length:408 start_codon:yes stop_codon:yes gene_type:complete